MRTTVTLDPDVAAKVKAEMRRSGQSFKEVVNRLVREGAESGSQRPADKPFKIDARDLQARPGLDFDNIGALLERLEGPFHK